VVALTVVAAIVAAAAAAVADPVGVLAAGQD